MLACHSVPAPAIATLLPQGPGMQTRRTAKESKQGMPQGMKHRGADGHFPGEELLSGSMQGSRAGW